jgi:hypothetical protein
MFLFRSSLFAFLIYIIDGLRFYSLGDMAGLTLGCFRKS